MRNKFNVGDLVNFDGSADFPEKEYPGVYRVKHGVGLITKVIDDYQVNWDSLVGDQTYDRVIEYNVMWSGKGTTRTYGRYLKMVCSAE